MSKRLKLPQLKLGQQAQDCMQRCERLLFSYKTCAVYLQLSFNFILLTYY